MYLNGNMEGGSSGGGRGSGSGDDLDGSDSGRTRKRYHRHTARQIQELEGVFKECPHPDEKQRLQLSRDLRLEPRQIKFWFQNRRTQMKAQHERADNCLLRAENEKIRCENIAIREALKNVICPSCGGSPLAEDAYFDEQKLRMENARLKEELDRISGIATSYIGRPISQLNSTSSLLVSSLDLPVLSSFSNCHGIEPSLDHDLLSGGSPLTSLPLAATCISDMEKSLMAEVASNSMEELIRVLQTNEPLWIISPTKGHEVLNLDMYNRVFPKSNIARSTTARIESSRASGVVIMNALTLVDMFMDSIKWVELFPTIISKARTLEVLSPGITGNRSGSLQLMYEELQVLCPLVSTREFIFLRYCQRIDRGAWVIVDVSFHFPRNDQFNPSSNSRKLPSGCLIQDMPNGYSKVTWVEHVEIEEKNQTRRNYDRLVNSGIAFGAPRWLVTLQRMCERFASSMVSGTSTRDLGGAILSPDGRRSMMKLAQRMINSFCDTISVSRGNQWTTVSGLNDVGIRVSVHKNTEPGQANDVILSAATSIWLPVSSQTVFTFFRDERTRAQWDILSNGNSVQEIAHIANGSHPGNCISVLRALSASQNSMLILQESCTDASGSLVVYAPVHLSAINIAMSGEDTSYIPLLPSGFTITPDIGGDNGASASSNMKSENCSITVAFQILVSNLPSVMLNSESAEIVNNLIRTTIQRIKSALNCT